MCNVRVAQKCFMFLDRHFYPDLPPAAIIQLEIHGFTQLLKGQYFMKHASVTIWWTTIQLPFPLLTLMNPWFLTKQT